MLLGALCAAPLTGALAQEDAAVANGMAGDAVRSLQQRILADPVTSERALALRDDPEMQAVLADPDIAAALARGDIAALLADPRIQRLAENPLVKDLGRDAAR